MLHPGCLGATTVVDILGPRNSHHDNGTIQSGEDVGVSLKIRGKPPKWMVKIMVPTLLKFMIWGETPLFLGWHPCVVLDSWSSSGKVGNLNRSIFPTSYQSNSVKLDGGGTVQSWYLLPPVETATKPCRNSGRILSQQSLLSIILKIFQQKKRCQVPPVESSWMKQSKMSKQSLFKS